MKRYPGSSEPALSTRFVESPALERMRIRTVRGTRHLGRRYLADLHCNLPVQATEDVLGLSALLRTKGRQMRP